MSRATITISAITLAMTSALSSGCVIYAVDSDTTAPVSRAPSIEWAEAGCYWDPYYADNIWYFEADVRDPTGVQDVNEVYADVYDNWSGQWVDSFELFPLDNYTWFSDWLEYSTYLDCYYRDYVVDFVAYDYAGNMDVYSVAPYVY